MTSTSIAHKKKNTTHWVRAEVHKCWVSRWERGNFHGSHVPVAKLENQKSTWHCVTSLSWKTPKTETTNRTFALWSHGEGQSQTTPSKFRWFLFFVVWIYSDNFFFLEFLLAVFVFCFFFVTCKCTLETAMMMATSDENPTGGVNLLGCGSQVPRDAFST